MVTIMLQRARTPPMRPIYEYDSTVYNNYYCSANKTIFFLWCFCCTCTIMRCDTLEKKYKIKIDHWFCVTEKKIPP